MAKKKKYNPNKLPSPKEYLTDEVLDYYGRLIKKGKIDEAIEFISRIYPAQIAYKFAQLSKKNILSVIEMEATEAEIGAAFSKINMTFKATEAAITEGVRLFTTHIIAKYFFEEVGITNTNIQKKILDSCLGQFESYIDGAMSNTQTQILSDIRNIQREWIKRNINIKNSKSINDLLYKTEAEFKGMLKDKYPKLYDAIEKGEILRSRTYVNSQGVETYKSYTLEEYTDFSVRATILNIDRNSTEIAAHSKNHKVVEYYLRDSRKIQTEEREICRHILSNKTHGKSLLAITSEAANVLGIKTIDIARSSGAMYIHCRHSIRPVSDEFNKEVEKIIALNEALPD